MKRDGAEDNDEGIKASKVCTDRVEINTSPAKYRILDIAHFPKGIRSPADRILYRAHYQLIT
eukprot:3640659-Ditylum_brightwellii.AAC.1